MDTKFHKYTRRTPRLGLLSEAERNDIKNQKIGRQLKWKLIDIKKGKLRLGLKALIEDFETIFASRELKDWHSDFFVINDLEKLSGLILKQREFQQIAIQRIKASRKTKTFYIERLTLDVIPNHSEWREQFFKRMTKGLKQNEKNFIGKYIRESGSFLLPLEIGKNYSWRELKHLLNSNLKKLINPGSKNTSSHSIIRKDEAWKIYHTRMTKEDKLKLTELRVTFKAILLEELINEHF